MVLEIPGKILGQEDVRETPAATATATAVGLTDGKYLVVDFHADMTDERKITAGTGIGFTDNGANNTFVIAVSGGTSYWSTPGIAFMQYEADDSRGFTGGRLDNSTGTTQQTAPVDLPHGAVVTACVVYGNDTGKTWTLNRANNNAGETIAAMATAAFNTEDSSISNATIDNETYTYFLHTNCGTGDDIDGARITYTT